MIIITHPINPTVIIIEHTNLFQLNDQLLDCNDALGWSWVKIYSSHPPDEKKHPPRNTMVWVDHFQIIGTI